MQQRGAALTVDPQDAAEGGHQVGIVEAADHAQPVVEAMGSGRPVAEPATVDSLTVPDETWSVVRLRAEARARGLTGMWDKTKAQLLAALS